MISNIGGHISGHIGGHISGHIGGHISGQLLNHLCHANDHLSRYVLKSKKFNLKT